MIVTVDTNVIVSGVLFGGVPGKIVRAAQEQIFTLALSPVLLEEIGRVFTRPKFGLDPGAVRLLMSEIESTAAIVYPKIRHQVVAEDADDDAVIDCAVEAHAEYIVSGDAHLTSMGVIEGITILTPKEFESRFEQGLP